MHLTLEAVHAGARPRNVFLFSRGGSACVSVGGGLAGQPGSAASAPKADLEDGPEGAGPHREQVIRTSLSDKNHLPGHRYVSGLDPVQVDTTGHLLAE